MLRKTTAAVVLAGALALGTASATSLGDFNDVSFAASGIGLVDCAISTDSVDLLPTIPDAETAVGDATVPTDGTFLLDSLDLTALAESLPVDCVGDLADVAIIGDHDADGGLSTPDQVLETITGIDLATADLTSVPVSGDFDIAIVNEVRLVVRNDA